MPIAPTAGAALILLGALATACSRADLADLSPASAGGTAGSGASSTGGSGGTASGGIGNSGAGASAGSGGSGGSGGSPRPCDALTWAGPPVFITLPAEPLSPSLVGVSDTTVALTYAEPTGSVTTLSSVALTDAFGNWPPTASATNPNFPSAQAFAVTTHEPGFFGFVADDPTAPSLAVGRAQPGMNGSTFSTVPNTPNSVWFAARTPLGHTIIGSGPDAYRSVFVVDPGPMPGVTDLGVIGCATPAVLSTAAVRTGIDAWFIASAVDAPGDSCADPDIPGPPSFVQVHRADKGSIIQIGSLEVLPFVVELDLDADALGGWLGVRAEGSLAYRVFAIDGRGTIAANPITTLSADLVPASHALVHVDDGAFIAQLISHENQPGGELNVRHVRADGTTAEVESGGDLFFPIGTPAALASADGRSVLIAFRSVDGVAPSIGLARADCI